MSLRAVPMTVKAAARYVAAHHRHNRAPQGGLFAVGVEEDGRLAGVAIAGRPIARLLADGKTVEVTRCCTDATRNACSFLYGRLCRAAADLGYARVVTYTLVEECGASLRAAGFVAMAAVKADATWSRPGRHRVQVDLFGDETRPPGDKVRWERVLGNQNGGG